MEPIRVGIVGLGRAGWGMITSDLRARPDQFRIAAGADVIPARARKLGAEFAAAAYTDYRELIADPDVELVVVATRSNTHVRIATEALQAGKHVLIEKPFALTLVAMDRLLRVAKHTPGKLIPRHNRRFDPDFIHVREVLASGILGDVRLVKLYRHGFNRRNDWQTLKRYGGGQLGNWGPHIIDHGLRFLGSPVRRFFGNLQRIAAAGDAEDHVKIVLGDGRNRVVDIEITGGCALGDVPYRVLGTLGTLVCDGRRTKLKYLDPAKLNPVKASSATPPDQTFGNPEKLPWIEEEREAVPRQPLEFWSSLYAHVRSDEAFPVSLAEARRVIWVMEEARKGTPFAVKFEE